MSSSTRFTSDLNGSKLSVNVSKYNSGGTTIQVISHRNTEMVAEQEINTFILLFTLGCGYDFFINSQIT